MSYRLILTYTDGAVLVKDFERVIDAVAYAYLEGDHVEIWEIEKII